MKQFTLERDTDVSGISGTGRVAEGIEFSDGTVVIRWLVGEHQSTVVWPSIDSVYAIHGHGGATRVVWKERLIHDDVTMEKVWTSFNASGLSENQIKDIVFNMQNAGILFRENDPG